MPLPHREVTGNTGMLPPCVVKPGAIYFGQAVKYSCLASLVTQISAKPAENIVEGNQQ